MTREARPAAATRPGTAPDGGVPADAATSPTRRADGRAPVRARPGAAARSTRRLDAGLLVLMVALGLIAGRLVWLQSFHADAYAAQAVEQRTTTTPLHAPRGKLLDRDGAVLAMSVPAYAVFGEPRVIAQSPCPAGGPKPCGPQAIGRALAPLVGVPASELEARLGLAPKDSGSDCGPRDLTGCKGFVYLARGLEPGAVAQIRELGAPGIGALSEHRRVAPAGAVAANVIGFTSAEGEGFAGAELQFDDVLTGRHGERVAEVDGAGRVMPSGRTRTIEPVAGRDVQLTIDRDLQWHVQEALAAAVADADAESATAALLDVRTGEVLALASVPTLDANDPGGADAALRGNRALTDVFEPGSTGKAITAAAVLEAGAVTPGTVMSVPDRLLLAGKSFKDSHDHPVQRMTFADVVAQSSNVGTIMAAHRIGGERLHEMLTRFGIGSRTGTELPGESPGILRDERDEWSGTDYGTHPIGQGYAVNGVQIASVYATIANGGTRAGPTVLRSVSDSRGWRRRRGRAPSASSAPTSPPSSGPCWKASPTTAGRRSQQPCRAIASRGRPGRRSAPHLAADTPTATRRALQGSLPRTPRGSPCPCPCTGPRTATTAKPWPHPSSAASWRSRSAPCRSRLARPPTARRPPTQSREAEGPAPDPVVPATTERRRHPAGSWSASPAHPPDRTLGRALRTRRLISTRRCRPGSRGPGRAPDSPEPHQHCSENGARAEDQGVYRARFAATARTRRRAKAGTPRCASSFRSDGPAGRTRGPGLLAAHSAATSAGRRASRGEPPGDGGSVARPCEVRMAAHAWGLVRRR